MNNIMKVELHNMNLSNPMHFLNLQNNFTQD